MEQVFTMQEVQEDRNMLAVAVVRNQFGSDMSFMDPCMMLIRNGCHCRDCSIINKDKYKRCKDDRELSLAYIKKIQASSLDNGFVKSDYSQSPKLAFNKLYSTLLWEPFVRLDSAGTEVTIFTNDLEGKFVVNVQGMSTNGPVYGRAEFSVERLPIEVATAPNWQSHK
jgi:hypothetical protein